MSQQRQFIAKSEAKAPFFVGIDLGGTNVKMGVVDDLGRTLSWLTIPTWSKKGEDASQRMAQAVDRVIRDAGLSRSDIAGLASRSPGTMDIPAGKLVIPANLSWEHFPIRDRVAHHSGFPVTFANDATAAAYENFGSARAAISTAWCS